MRIPLAYVVELVVALAAGLALARWTCSGVTGLGFRSATLVLNTVRYTVEPTLCGLALVGCAGLAVELARKRSPKIWGLGRWVWAVSGGLILMELAVQLGFESILLWKRGGYTALSSQLSRLARGLLSSHFFSQGAWFLLCICVIAWLAGQLKDPGPDAREWSGRAFLAILVAWAISCRILMVLAVR
jgi:hypothetical protein